MERMMEAIVNEHLMGPQGETLRSFKGESCAKILLPLGTELYRIVTKEDLSKGVEGNQFIEGTFWFDGSTYNKIGAKVNYMNHLCNVTELSRTGLAITTNFSTGAEALICICLKKNIYGWKGKAASQEEYLNNGRSIILSGNLSQLWVPNLTPHIASLQFFHSI